MFKQHSLPLCQLLFLSLLVPPSKPTVNIPSSATIGNRAVLTCSEPDGSPPSEYTWFKDGTVMPTDPKNNRAFSNSSYTLDPKTGELVWMGVEDVWESLSKQQIEQVRVGDIEDKFLAFLSRKPIFFFFRFLIPCQPLILENTLVRHRMVLGHL